MGELARKLLAEVLNLPEDERDNFIGELVANLDGPLDPGAEEAWAKEIEVRARRALDGSSPGVPWEQVKLELESRLKK